MFIQKSSRVIARVSGWVSLLALLIPVAHAENVLYIHVGTVLVSAGMAGAVFISEPWHLYLTLGLLVVGGSLFVSFFGHSLFLPNWFVRRRGLAVGIAFSGVGVGSNQFGLNTVSIGVGPHPTDQGDQDVRCSHRRIWLRPRLRDLQTNSGVDHCKSVQ